MRKFCNLFFAILLIILSTSFHAYASKDITPQSPVEYSVTVPASLSPGDKGFVKVEGTWRNNQMLKISCPDEITLEYKDQTLDVRVIFSGISQQGLNEEYISIRKEISIEDIEVSFGTWTGTIHYDVELITDEGAVVDEPETTETEPKEIPTEPEVTEPEEAPTNPTTPSIPPIEDDSAEPEEEPTLPPIETEPEEESEEDIPPLPEY